GEVYAHVAPRGDEPMRMLGEAGQRGGRTAVAAQAQTLEAQYRAARGEPAETVMGIIRSAGQIQEALPAVTGWPRWTAGHYLTFAGLAAVRCGALTEGARMLSDARAETAGSPGIASAAVIYTAHGYAAAGQWDGALQAARDALAVSGDRGVPAWLAGNGLSLARQARGRGGDWPSLRAAVAVEV